MNVKGWNGEDVVIFCACGHEPVEDHRNAQDLFGQITIGCRRCDCGATPMIAQASAGKAVGVARSLGILPPRGYVAPKKCSCGLTLTKAGECPVPEAHER